MAAAVLLTLAQAKAHLGITLPAGDAGDADLQLKLDQSEAVIRKYLKKQDDPTWTPETVPPPITAAILLMLARLEQDRGDATRDQDSDEQVWGSITRMLSLYRDPGLR